MLESTLQFYFRDRSTFRSAWPADTRRETPLPPEAIQSAYRENPFHNVVHGADVLHAMYWLLNADGLGDRGPRRHLLCRIRRTGGFTCTLRESFGSCAGHCAVT